MKNLESVASQVTVFGTPLEINHEKDTKHGVFFPFLATLLLIAIISGSAVSSIKDLLNYNKITVTGFRELVLLYWCRIHTEKRLMGLCQCLHSDSTTWAIRNWLNLFKPILSISTGSYNLAIISIILSLARRSTGPCFLKHTSQISISPTIIVSILLAYS